MKCRLCNKSAHEIGGWLERVNEKGVAGIWECRPSCDAQMSRDDALLGAIESTEFANADGWEGSKLGGSNE